MPDRSETSVRQLHAALDGKLEGYLRTDEASRAMWSTDASIYLRKPVGVVVARTEEDVELTLSAARDLGLSITPRGTGTSLAGQATAPGLALDVSEMRRAMEIGERYNDEIKRRFPKMIRRVSGYGLDALVDPETLDLTRLICGSEGTLAVVTRAGFRLRPLPETRALASFEFDTLSAAARATGLFLQMNPSAIELLDDVAIGRARANSVYRDSTRFVQGDPKAVLVVEWSGTKKELDERFANLDDLTGEVEATAATPLRTKEEMGQTVLLRKSTLPLLLSTADDEKPVAFVEDAAVPPNRLEEFVERFEEIVEKNGTWACFYGHASVGCLHVRPALDTSDPEGVLRMRRIAEEVADLVVDCGGARSRGGGGGRSRSGGLGEICGG